MTNKPHEPGQPPAAPPSPRRRWRWLAALVSLVAVGTLALTLVALPHTATGTRWLLGWVPGLTVEAPQGALLGSFSAERLRWQSGTGPAIELQQLAWSDLSWRHTDGGWSLHAPALRVASLRIGASSAPATPTRLPAGVVLPVGVDIDALAIDRIDIAALPEQPVRDVRATVHLGAGPSATHRVDGLALAWEQLRASGRAALQARLPMALSADMDLKAIPADAADPSLRDNWQAALHAAGPLRRLVATARLSARRQALDARAVVEPEAAQPLTELQAQTTAFDLAALSTRWPRTALTGRVLLRHDAANNAAKQTAGTPLLVDAQLRNDAAAALSDNGLPVRNLVLTARSDAQSPRQGRIDAFRAELGSARQSAGHIDGQGTWAPGTADGAIALDLGLRLTDVLPASVDAQAPAWRLAGSVRLTGQTDGARTAPLRLRGDVRGAALSGTPQAPPLPVAVTLDAQAAWQPGPLVVTLHTVDARAGTGRAQATGELRQTGTGWQVTGQAALEAFDPSTWWRGPWSAGSDAANAWQRGPHRLDGSLQVGATIPGHRTDLALLKGQATAHLAPTSRLLGVPLAGDFTFQGDGRQGRATAALRAGADQPAGQPPGQLDADVTLQAGAAQDLRATLRARLPQLAAFTPWLRLALPAHATWQGDATGDLQLTGRWPRLQAEGRLDSRQFDLAPGGQRGAASTISIRGLRAQGRAGTQPGDTLALDIAVDTLRAATWRADQARLMLDGTQAAHRLRVQTLAQPVAQASRTASPARQVWAVLRADGGLTGASLGDRLGSAPQGSPSWGWRGTLTELSVADAPPTTAAATTTAATNPAASTPWLVLAPTALRFEQGNGRRELQAAATRLQLMDAAMVLSPLRWVQEARGTTLALQAELQPWPVAPLLAKLQPDFGWQGDLRVAGTLQLNATPDNVRGSLALQRASGDLVVRDSMSLSPPQALELTELALSADTDRGQWRLQQRITGSRMGALTGDQRLRTTPSALLPPADASIDGDLTLQVAEVGQWGRWLPAGWRMAGHLLAEARIAGQLGAPQLTGELHGQRLAVRNVLEGVDWRDAEVHMHLTGDDARIDQLRVRAGTGWLTASGTAHLGRSPRLDLQASADHFAALQRVDRRVVVSGTAQVALDDAVLRATAQLTADEGRIDIGQGDAPTLAGDVQVRRGGEPAAATRGDTEARTSAAKSSNPRQVALDVRADLGPAFFLRGRGLNTRLAGELHLTSPNSRPQLAGTVRAVDGTYAAYGQKLGIDRGLITFGGEVNNPRLDILATRSDLDSVKVGVAVTGTAQTPRVRLYSDQSLSDTDKLSWLLLGRGSDGLGGTDLAMLQRAAYAVIAGDSDKPGVVQRLGLDTLSVGQRDATSGDTTVRQTVVSLGKQLSQRWYVGYERSLQATAGSWQLIYRLAQRFTVRAQSGYTSSGVTENAIDLIWTWRWGE